MDTSATNKTTNYGLPIFIGTDKPSWLVDWNNSMTEIDTILKNIDSKGVATQSEVDALTISMTSAQDAISEIGDNLNTLTSTVGGHTTSIDLLGTDVANIKDDLIAQNKLIKTLSDTVIGLQEMVNSVKSDLDALESDVITTRTGLTAVDDRVDGMGRDVTSLRSELTTVDGKVDLLNTKDVMMVKSTLSNELIFDIDTGVKIYAAYEVTVQLVNSTRIAPPIVVYFEDGQVISQGITTNDFALGTAPTFEKFTVKVSRKTGYINVNVNAPFDLGKCIVCVKWLYKQQ